MESFKINFEQNKATGLKPKWKKQSKNKKREETDQIECETQFFFVAENKYTTL